MFNPFSFYANAVRAKEIAKVLAHYGFRDLLYHLDRQPGLLHKIAPKPQDNRTTWERLRLACEDLGPTFVKFGQLLSTRPDIVPEPLMVEFRKLQDSVRPNSLEEIRAVAREEMGCELEDVFEFFEEEPRAAASMAQVYFARLKSGEEVAIKIQRPGIEATIEADLEILHWFARQLHQRVETLRPYDLPSILSVLEKAIVQELDFENEGRNMRIFNAENGFPEHVFAPRVYEELTTSRMLVMERVNGKRPDEAELSAEEKREIAEYGAKSLMHQVLVSGFFHADPHAGNVAVTPDLRICLFDWGMAGQLTRRMRENLADLFIAAIHHDAERVVSIAGSLSYSGRRIDERRMEKEVEYTLREQLDFEEENPKIGQLILRLLYVFGSHGIDVIEDYSLMAKSVLSIEEMATDLDPDFDIREIAEPILRKIQRERRNPVRVLHETADAVRSVVHLVKELPNEIGRVVRRVGNDDLTLNFQHKGLEELGQSLNTASNRITLGVIVGSLLIGSSLIITTGIQPHLFGFPAIGIIGYLLSAILGFWIIVDIIRRDRHR